MKRKKLEKLNLAVTAAIMLVGSGLPTWAKDIPGLRSTLITDAACDSSSQGSNRDNHDCVFPGHFPKGSEG